MWCHLQNHFNTLFFHAKGPTGPSIWQGIKSVVGKMNHDSMLEKLRKNIHSLLISSGVDMDADMLRRDYETMIGHPLPLKPLGFRNVMDMVYEMPDVVSVHLKEDGRTILKAVGHESTRHIEKLVSKQRTSVAGNRRKFRNSHQSKVVPPRRGAAPLAIPPQFRAQLRLLLSQGPLRLSELETSFRQRFGSMLLVHDLGFHSIGEMLEAATDLVTIQQGRYGSILTLREQMMPRPFNMQQSHRAVPTTMNASVEIPRKFQAAGSSGNECSSEFNDNLQLTDRNPEPQALLCPKGQHFHERSLKRQEQFRLKIVENGLAAAICHKFKEKLLKVISQSSCEISVSNLSEEYKRFWDEELPLKKNGYVSVTELVDSISDIVDIRCVDEDGKLNWTVNNIQVSAPLHSDDPVANQPETGFSTTESLWECGSDDGHSESQDENKDDEQLTMAHQVKQEEIFELCASISVCHTTVPLDALQNQHLKRPTTHDAFEVSPVRVVHVESPALFYIAFIEGWETRTFENMKVEMRECYSSPDVSERYRLPKEFVRRGQVCCASSKGMLFSRGVIHQVISPTSVEVYHVDFGMVTTVHTAHLMFLKAYFNILPAQAVPSSLFGIKPTSGTWTSEAISSFVSLCCNHSLMAGVVCYAGDVLLLYLSDTHTEEDIFIHRVLINQDYGEACSPSASKVMCDHINPLSLYLGEGTFYLPEVKEETTQSVKTSNQSLPITVEEIFIQHTFFDVEDNEMPALELIENQSISVNYQNPSHMEEKLEFIGMGPHEKINDPVFQASEPGDQTSGRRPVRSTKCPVDAHPFYQTSGRPNIQSTKRPVDAHPFYQTAGRPNIQSTKRPVDAHPFYQTSGRPNIQSTKRPVDAHPFYQTAGRPNIQSTKRPVDAHPFYQTAGRPNIQSTKRPVDAHPFYQTSGRPNIQSTKRPVDAHPFYQTAGRPNIQSTKRPVDAHPFYQISGRSNIQSTKRPVDAHPFYQTAGRPNIQSTKRLSTKRPVTRENM
ncbi:tudor domain-containing protein 5 isoform X2 [Stigmatopora argus]